MAHPQPTGNMLNDFLNGVRKAVDVNLYTQIPNFCMAFALIQVLNVTGVMAIIGKLLGPVMAIFGLPGEGAAILAASWLSSSGGIGATVALIQEGTLNGLHAVILVPMIMAIGGQIQMMSRILAVAKTPQKYYPLIFGIGILNTAFAGLLMRLLVRF